MKYFLVLILNLFLLSCTKDHVDVYTIASKKKEITDPADPAYGTWYLSNSQNNSSWKPLARSIVGFDEIYEDGCEYVLKKEVRIDVGDSDRFPIEYYLKEVVSKEKKTSDLPTLYKFAK